jgi:predicted nucleic acid-binding protein
MSAQRILVDSNALADLFIGAPDLQADAENLRRRHPAWVAPPLIRCEFGNVLRTYVRRGRKTEEESLVMFRTGLGMVRLCGEPSAELILREAHASDLTFYDATYVACAKALRLPIFTRDEDILGNCPGLARRISEA